MTNYSRGDVIALWSIQESLLQSYRQIYLSSQSILVSAAVLLLEAPNPSEKINISRTLLMLLGLTTLFLWTKTASHRRKAVTYVQAQLLEVDSGGQVEQLYLRMQQYSNGNLEHSPSLERFREVVVAAKQDVFVGQLLQMLPALFAIVWAYIGWAYWLAR